MEHTMPDSYTDAQLALFIAAEDERWALPAGDDETTDIESVIKRAREYLDFLRNEG